MRVPPEAEHLLDEFDAERFWSHVSEHGGRPYADDPLATAQGECWIWNGRLDDYGRFKLHSTWHAAHRIAYRDFGHPLPPAMELDHLCRISGCVNPAHVEPVSHTVNVQRGLVALKTHCKWGHEFTPENTLVPRGRPTRRICRACQRARKGRGNTPDDRLSEPRPVDIG